MPALCEHLVDLMTTPSVVKVLAESLEDPPLYELIYLLLELMMY